MKKTIVLYPGLAVSHFIPMMQFANSLLGEGYAAVVTLINVTMKHNIPFAADVDRAAASKPSVTFHTLPSDPKPSHHHQQRAAASRLIRHYNKHLHEFLSSLPPRNIHTVIVDSLSNEALDVTKELGIPSYVFFTSNASALAAFLQVPWVCTEGPPSFKELGDATLNFHGVPPVPASHHMGEMLKDPESEVYKVMTKSYSKNLEADDILVNTFASLEARAVELWKPSRTLGFSAKVGSRCLRCSASSDSSRVPLAQKKSMSAWHGSTSNQSIMFCSFALEV
ncbi:hypothetical protein SETIT_3G171000v2 [Setaria italica]|uniref:UDP-glycosyltransferases domain-containing protein n=1 Tax=Setaria italica TaxID=4555 RepID=A0A368QGB5_SETIT|nr:hypothetical protein SETIT_3G171000v2 [Setaria italica]